MRSGVNYSQIMINDRILKKSVFKRSDAILPNMIFLINVYLFSILILILNEAFLKKLVFLGKKHFWWSEAGIHVRWC